jgi:threonine aldolase
VFFFNVVFAVFLTCLWLGGKILPLEYINRVAVLCKAHNIKLHMDGARFFNAVVGSGIPAKTILENVDRCRDNVSMICIILSRRSQLDKIKAKFFWFFIII